MAAETMVLHGLTPRGMSVEDFDTASIRSAAPSYVSEAPSYHTLPPNEAVPPYTPPATTTTTTTTNASTRTSAPSRQVSSMLNPTPESRSSFAPGVGLPPIPRRSEMLSTPSLSHFNISPWSSISTGNPQVRHYQSVANRRVAAASASAGPSSAVEGALRAALSRVQAANADASEEDGRVRHLEDPYLVGEEAAARARNERLARKYEEDILILEDRRWDRWLDQMRDVEERKRNWSAFRTNVDRETNNRRRLTRRFGR
ncbi:hypothetical protein F5X97DRAFT_327702 [Nemania serpens]|nr:hypothetical protein F5X97DRAFT_327702 [Nemania serpens]